MKTGIMLAANGARLGHETHKQIPLDTKSLIQTAVECNKLGVQALHVHIRDEKSKHLLDAIKYRLTLDALKSALPKDFILQATSEAVGIYESNEMISVIKNLKPQAASVAISELLRDDKINTLKEAKNFYTFAREENIGIQHILYSAQDLIKFNKLLEREIITGDKHSVLFVLGRYSKNQKSSVKDLLPYLQALKDLKLQDQLTWMVCAFGSNEIPSLVTAASLGGHLRIGFENSRVLPNEIEAKNNEETVQYLKTCLNLLNIKQVENLQMREILGIYK